MTDYQTAVTRYFEAWNATDAASRATAVAQACTEDVTYTDPVADVQGQDGLATVIAGAQQQFPGFSFVLLGTVDAHHHIARFGWELRAPDGSAPVAGFDAVTLAEDGRIRSVLGFLDRVPAA
ncbi:nuclear transport factor 2 family protein [Streptomyces sp. N2-109]|uniref:Nuclear transport factor 2 family protein n=1 Tax=Streptomyces gossypii TaxID=2883101 RepID=A0ABT2JZY8_9ACTN|nr:nuclear transport factor 2 family protein [Streptomyces gossypii]MCT2593487.1 nuclear transport factor 2 family protein [Streptomyces gossypii]